MSRIILIFLTFLTVFAGIFCDSLDNPRVSIPAGKIQGTYRKSYGGRTIAAFEGIPYAKPPIGELRFEAPHDVESWPGVWQANQVHTCIQHLPRILGGDGSVVGSEDCLYINVYTPRETPKENEKLPVLVHIHGGAFHFGSGHLYTLPDYLLDRDFVLVTLNYRLSAFGFLSTEDQVVPGNNGLKDQVKALQWVQNNIKYFGGNPNSVTIDGFSAGAAAVHYHYLSPLSKGLFHRGYSHSGTAVNTWSVRQSSGYVLKNIASAVGCGELTTSKSIVDCLKTRPAYQITVQIEKLYGDHGMPFGPVAEPKSEGAFIDEHPWELLKSGRINDVPWINSYTKNDIIFLLGVYAQLIGTEALNQHLPAGLYLKVDDKDIPAVVQKIKQFYFGKDEITNTKEDLDTFEKLLTDRVFRISAIQASLLHAKVAKSPVYNILYNYRTDNNFLQVFAPERDLGYGVGHGDDIVLTFASTPHANLTEDDIKIKDTFLDLLVSFSETNAPKVEGVHWEPTSPSSDLLTYLEINGPNDIKVTKEKEYLKALQFWESLPLNEHTVLPSKRDEL